MDEIRLDYCHKLLDDHEDRLRKIEQDREIEVRVEILEAYMKGEIGLTKQRKEGKTDIYALVGMIVSVATFVILVWKLS